MLNNKLTVVKTGTHEDLARQHRIDPPSERSFGVVWCVLLLAVALWPLTRGQAPRYWLLAVALVLALVTWIRPGLLYWLNRAWFHLGLLLGRIVAPVVSGVLFFLVFTPAGLLSRLFRGDPLHLRWNAEADTYWVRRVPPGPPPETMSNQF